MSVTELLSPNGLVMAVAELKPSVSGLFGLEPETIKDLCNFYPDLGRIRFIAFIFQKKFKKILQDGLYGALRNQ